MRALALLLVSLSATAAAGQMRTVKPNQYGKKRAATPPVFSASFSGDCPGTAVTGSPGVSISLTRATSATCTKNDASTVLVTSGQPRVNSSGLLVEPAATNLMLRSTELDNAAWTANNLTAAAITVTANAGVAPDGTTTAERFQQPAVATGQYSQRYQTFTGTVAAYTHSVYVKGVSGSGSTTFRFQTGATVAGLVTCNFTSTAYTRCTSTATLSGAVWLAITGADATGYGAGAASAADFYIWGEQTELGSSATGHIPTAGTTATRNVELYAFTPPAQWPVATGDVTVVFKPGPSSLGLGRLIHARGATDGFSLYYSGNSVRLDTGNATTLSTLTGVVASWVAGQTYTIRATWGAGNTAVYRDGVLLASVTNGSSNMPTTAVASVGLGNGASQIVNGYISSVTVTR